MPKIWLTCNFPLVSLKSRRKLRNAIKILRENNFQLRIRYLFKISNKGKSRINTLKDLTSLKNNCLSWTLSQKVTRGYTPPKRGSKWGKKMPWDPTGDLGQVRGPGTQDTVKSDWVSSLCSRHRGQQASLQWVKNLKSNFFQKTLMEQRQEDKSTVILEKDQGTALGKTGLES